MQVDLLNKNKAVYTLVRMMRSENKSFLFTGYANGRKSAFIKELRTYFPSRVTLNATSVPTSLPETVRLIIVENVSDIKTLNQWLKLQAEGIPADLDPNRIIYPYLVIAFTISKDKFKTLKLELINSIEIIDLN